MTAFQVMPALLPDEYDALRTDIAANGVRVPVDVDENGQVLDGHHRSLIAAELGVPCPRRVLDGLTEAEKLAHAMAVNVHRRNLTREQRRNLLAASIKAEPAASDREHGRRVGAHHETASSVRADLVASGDVAETATRVDSLGRQQPVTKVHTTETTYVDNTTGEVVTSDEWLDAQPGRSPVEEYLAAAPDADDRTYARAFLSALGRAQGLVGFDPDRLRELLTTSEVEQVRLAAQSTANFFAAMNSPRTLRAINGGTR